MAEESRAASFVIRRVDGSESASNLIIRSWTDSKSAGRSSPAPPTQTAANIGRAKGRDIRQPLGKSDLGRSAIARVIAVEIVKSAASCPRVTL